MGLESKVRNTLRERMDTWDVLPVIVESDFESYEREELFEALLNIITFDYKRKDRDIKLSAAASIKELVSIDMLLNSGYLTRHIQFSSPDIKAEGQKLVYGLSRSLEFDEEYEGARALLLVYSEQYPEDVISMITRDDLSGKSVARLSENIVPQIPNFAEYLLPVLKGKRTGMAKKILKENKYRSQQQLLELGETAAMVLSPHLDDPRFADYVEEFIVNLGEDSIPVLHHLNLRTAEGRSRQLRLYSKLQRKNYQTTNLAYSQQT